MSDEQEKIEKILTRLDEDFCKLSDFAKEIGASNDDVLKSIAFCIGTCIATKHWRFFRQNRQQTVRWYQGWIQAGMDHGWKELQEEQNAKKNTTI